MWFLLATVSASSSISPDECQVLWQTFGNPGRIRGPSHCSHDGYCSGLVFRSAADGTQFTDGRIGNIYLVNRFGQRESNRVTCDWAFEQVVLLTHTRYLSEDSIPFTPVFDDDEYFEGTIGEHEYRSAIERDERDISETESDDSEYSDEDYVEQMNESFPDLVPFYEHLESTLDDMVDNRILARFPRLVYIHEIDRPLLQSVSRSARQIKELVSENSNMKEILHACMRHSLSIRKFFWSISIMMEYLVGTPGMSFKDTQIALIAFTPYIHLLTHLSAHLDFIIPRYFSGYQNVIASIVKYDPRYLVRGVWMIKLGPEFVDRDVLDLSIDIPTADFIETLADDYLEGEDILDVFNESLRYVSEKERSQSDPVVRKIAVIIYILRYYGEFDNESVFKLMKQRLQLICNRHEEWINSIALTENVFPSSVHKLTIAGLLSLCKDSILSLTSFSYLHTMAAIAYERVPIRSRDNRRHLWIDISQGAATRQEDLLRNSLQRFASLDKYHLAGEVRLSFTMARDRTGSYPGGLAAYYKDILAAIFRPESGLFSRRETHTPISRFSREGRRSRPLRLRPRIIRTFRYTARIPSTQGATDDYIAIGRIIGCILRDGNPNSVLDKYFRHNMGQSEPPRSVLSGFFFGSEYIRRGFYDLFLHGGIERIFENAFNTALMIDRVGSMQFSFLHGDEALVT